MRHSARPVDEIQNIIGRTPTPTQFMVWRDGQTDRYAVRSYPNALGDTV